MHRKPVPLFQNSTLQSDISINNFIFKYSAAKIKLNAREQRNLMDYIGSFDEINPFVYPSVLLFDKSFGFFISVKNVFV